MNDVELLAAFRNVGIVPVIRAATADEAIAIGTGLATGGLTVLEATFTTPDAERVIRELSALPYVTVGAGTVLTPDQADAAANAGAEFLVSPVWLPWLPKIARELSVAAVPGAATPTEVWAAHLSGALAVKVFPIARLGGAAYVRDLLAPLPELQLVATGGVDLAMCAELLQAGCVAVGMGGIHADASLGPDPSSRALAARAHLTNEAEARPTHISAGAPPRGRPAVKED